MAGRHSRAEVPRADLTRAAAAARPRETARNTPPDGTARVPYRILLAEGRATAKSELSKRLTQLGHEVLGRVTTAQGAMDYAALLHPDVVVLAPVLEDGSGLTTAIAVIRANPGAAAVVLTGHPAAADPSARPNWGAVAVMPVDAAPDDLGAELRRVIARARAAPSAAQPVGPSADSSADALADPLADVSLEELPGAAPDTPRPGAAAAAPPSAAQASVPPLSVAPLSVPEPSDDELVRRAAECLLERTGLSHLDAMRLMEAEAADSGQSLAHVARGVLGEEQGAPESGAVAAVA